MTDPSMGGFQLVGAPGVATMPDGSTINLRWQLSGTPDGQWEADFAGPWQADFGGRWEIDLPRFHRGQPGPSVNGSTIVWLVPREHQEEVEQFVERQMDHANRLLEPRARVRLSDRSLPFPPKGRYGVTFQSWPGT